MAKSETRPDVLYARMLGGFTLKYNGALIAGGSKFSESQFIYLLQILLHHRKTGVSRDRLEELLFEGRELADVHHTLQSIIYNAKTRLKKLGLPPANYIVQRGGLFYWTDEIPVEEDAERFEALLEQAEATSDADERLALLTDAIHAYGGEFLPMQAAVIWVAQEARHCRERFCYAVEQAVELLRQHQDFFQMEALGRYCAKIDPLADWEAVTMEALAALGRYDDARRLYDGATLADLYDPDNETFFPELMAAHRKLDAAVERAYGVDFNGDEEKIVAHLFRLYAEKTKE